jgi:hypothetical protein
MTKCAVSLFLILLIPPAFAIEAPDDFSVVNLPKNTLLTFTKAQTLTRMQVQSDAVPSSDNSFNLNNEIQSLFSEVLFSTVSRDDGQRYIRKFFSEQINTTDRTYFVGVTNRTIDRKFPQEVQVECILMASTAKTDLAQVGVDINRSLLLSTGAQTSKDKVSTANQAIGFTIVKLNFSDDLKNFFENLTCQLHFADKTVILPLIDDRNTFSVLELKKLFPGLTVDLPEDLFR